MAFGTNSEDIQTAARAAVNTNTAVPGIDTVMPTPPNADVAVVTLAANTATNVFALAPTHLGRTIYNGTGSPVNIKFGAGASATSFTTILAAGAYYEVPFYYDGIITAFSGTASVAPHLLSTAVRY